MGFRTNFESGGDNDIDTHIPFMPDRLSRFIGFLPPGASGVFLCEPTFQLVGRHVDQFVPFPNCERRIQVRENEVRRDSSTYSMTVCLSLTMVDYYIYGTLKTSSLFITLPVSKVIFFDFFKK